MGWFAGILCISGLVAAGPAAASSLFEDRSVIEIELTGPFSELIRNSEDRPVRPFRLTIDGRDLDISVRPRGKSRLRVCEFPPLRLDFTGSEAGGTVFEGHSRLKLVTHCLNGDSGEINVIEEYAAYRIFGLLTPVAYRVRLLRIRYSDPGGGLDPDASPRHGFLIEPLGRLAARLGGAPLEVDGIALGRIDREQAALVYVFQYMIGNTDWSFVLAEDEDACCHNGDLLEIGADIYYLPYDFDLAGIVNARYAEPDPSLRLRSVRSRYYRGFCTDPDTLRGAIRRVASLRPDILDTVQDLPALTAKDRDKIADYLEQFFKKAEKEDKLLKMYGQRCISP